VSLTVGGLAGTGTVDDVSGALTPVLTVSNSSATATTFGGVIQNTTGVVTLVNAAGTLVLTGTNTYGTTGQVNTTVSGGNLVLGAGGTTGSVTGNILSNSVLTVNRSDVSLAFGNNVSGTGGFVTAGTGTVTLTGVNTYTGTTTVSAGTLVIPAVSAIHANNQIVDNSALIIDAGTKTTPVILGTSSVAGITGTGSLTVGVAGTAGYVQLPNGGSATVGSLTINSGSTLDIDAPGTSFGKLVVNYGVNADPSSTIRGYLKTGYAGGVWTGTGLTSTAVASEVAGVIAAHTGGVYGIGYVDGSVDNNQASNAVVKAVGNQIVYTPALIGDANLDGSVTFIDLGIVAQNLGKNSDWEHGDFNYDGTVNFLDIGLLAQNLSKSILNTPLSELIPDPSATLVADWNLAVAEVSANTQPTDVPEPGMIGLLAVGAGGLLARRRRKA
jgi:autotransporter-associated beta strand protein